MGSLRNLPKDKQSAQPEKSEKITYKFEVSFLAEVTMRTKYEWTGTIVEINASFQEEIKRLIGILRNPNHYGHIIQSIEGFEDCLNQLYGEYYIFLKKHYSIPLGGS